MSRSLYVGVFSLVHPVDVDVRSSSQLVSSVLKPMPVIKTTSAMSSQRRCQLLLNAVQEQYLALCVQQQQQNDPSEGNNNKLNNKKAMHKALYKLTTKLPSSASSSASSSPNDEKPLSPSKNQNRSREHKCSFPGCKSSFVLPQHLARHMLLHNGDRPFHCDHEGCQKRFNRLDDLKIHSRTHTGERPYVCNFGGCGMAFTQNCALLRHQRTQHLGKSLARDDSSTSPGSGH